MDPYKVLGISPSATDDEVKKAYKLLAKKYHPDMHAGAPDQKMYEQKFKQVQEAYNIILDQRQHGGSSYGSGYGNQSGGYGNPGGYGAGSSYQSTEFQAAANYLNTRRFREARTVLDSISMDKRSAQWYYLSALAHAGLGNNIAARQHAEQAMRMDPSQPEYRYLVQQLAYSGNSYTRTQRQYNPAASGLGSCATCCLFNLILNLCCC